MRYLLIATAAICPTLRRTCFRSSDAAKRATCAEPAQAGLFVYGTAGQWLPPYGQPVPQKTRAQIYRELVQAERDGQLAYLDSTIYAH